MINKFSAVLASAAIATGTVATLATAPAHAATCNVSNVTLGGLNANACEGSFSGNDTGNSSTLLNDLNNGLFSVGANVTWDLIGKSDEGPIDLIAANGSNTGAWSLTEEIVNSGLSTFAISLKAGPRYSVYLFQDIDFTATGLAGMFNTIGVDLNGNRSAGKDLSHASLFRANVVTTPDTTSVPEPASLVALGLVAGGMVVSRRRRRTLPN
ncbi:PEP-CTERM sorting domain-containing protein [Nodularia sp. UHCC 0506]|uniref:PEP-CTERM sorting domain-containing protein n=1 Tax=Nodularia sp. UHCC 0506 TaxID=3110243 RepID=UPI002B1E909A|nr:PEP-CTERM sorting domain-containing protein [Nodularia sp. UHCC 0506]MEA5516816.1 PEP-CTERM sorting domain-containing protein [Nodularia sp. UHCC 0506]